MMTEADVDLVRALPATPSRLSLDLTKLDATSPRKLLKKLQRRAPRNLKEHFRALDVDGSGTIEPKELHSMLQQQGFSQSESNSILKLLDPEGRGHVRYHDFFSAVHRPSPAVVRNDISPDAALARVRSLVTTKHEHLQRAFRQYDANHDGHIDKTEFESCMAAWGVHPADVATLQKAFDPTDVGAIDYKRFLHVVDGGDRDQTELANLHLPQHGQNKGRKTRKPGIEPAPDGSKGQSGPKTKAQLLHHLRTTAKVANPKDFFRKYDADGNGTLEQREIVSCLASLGWNEQDTEGLLRVLDPHSAGAVAYASFFDNVTAIDAPVVTTKSVDASFHTVVEMLAAKAKHIHHLFRRFDVDGDGTIDLTEFHTCLSHLGVLPVDAANVVAKFDPNQTGIIDFGQFRAAVLHHDTASEWAPLHLVAEKTVGVKQFPAKHNHKSPVFTSEAVPSVPATLHAHYLERLRLKHSDLRVAFRNYDKKKLGRLDRRAFEACLKSVGGRPEDIAAVWAHLAGDDDAVPFHSFAQSQTVAPPSPTKLQHKQGLRAHALDTLQKKTKVSSKALRALYRACDPDAVGVFAKERLRHEMQAQLKLSPDQVDTLLRHMPSQMEERDLAACLYKSSPYVGAARLHFKDAQRLLRLEETHPKQLRALFRTMDEDKTNQVVHTCLTSSALSGALKNAFGVEIPPERLAALIPPVATYSQVLQAAHAAVTAEPHETSSPIDFHGRLLGCRALLCPRATSDPSFLGHDMRPRDNAAAMRRSFPGPSDAAGLDSAGFHARCSALHIDTTAQDTPMDRDVAPRWKLKAVDGAHEKVGLGGGRKRMAARNIEHDHKMRSLLAHDASS
ncbi:hypothetical protein SDRG_13189 [Saprolegnia diclina VS20]|uniref:EF-hand domain-containing protein n=1 Tax=Saprolegnia diclina (strain VS20) TaxID=1156394 RepID=T0RA68_SAPDV|nr:hypothetical protein SDRG_13189 [Saprolegnia diclina VS20]EQC29033.1 hypothetical protein SDRG_13189 [Saprolegnia diclina VS20]|eukprot:XP_008617492.1 hypothetical protein SDRG_13189 [Saprolegnia diclina VS20]